MRCRHHATRLKTEHPTPKVLTSEVNPGVKEGTFEMSLFNGPPEHWHVTTDEVLAHYPCDRLAETPIRVLTRGINIDAPTAVAFRWLCQLRVAPYSYDWIDNCGRKSPRTLSPGLEGLAKGQRFLIGELTDFAVDQQITLRATPLAKRWYGLVAMTYQVTDRGLAGSRIVVRLIVDEPTRWWQHLRFHLLAWGDLIMMRKQLVTLKGLAEKSAQDLQPVRQ